MKEDLIELLKNKIWEQYLEVKGGDFPQWYEGLNPIQKVMWETRFDERNEYRIK